VAISNTSINCGDVMCLADGTVESFQMNIPRINTEYVGSGDLFAALLLAWMHQHPHDLKVGH